MAACMRTSRNGEELASRTLLTLADMCCRIL